MSCLIIEMSFQLLFGSFFFIRVSYMYINPIVYSFPYLYTLHTQLVYCIIRVLKVVSVYKTTSEIWTLRPACPNSVHDTKRCNVHCTCIIISSHVVCLYSIHHVHTMFTCVSILCTCTVVWRMLSVYYDLMLVPKKISIQWNRSNQDTLKWGYLGHFSRVPKVVSVYKITPERRILRPVPMMSQ